MCGGTTTPKIPSTLIWGLSPRVRGNPRPLYSRIAQPRSIPACAGEPPRSLDARYVVTVYPRVCGGTSPRPMADFPKTGLSPRVRGNLSHADPPGSWPGSIPACAGEPASHVQTRHWCEVYPRVCGGTNDIPVPDGLSAGLSPRVRGNQGYTAVFHAPSRSIPACAGEPPPAIVSLPVNEVYPRVCGGTRD